MKISIAMSLAAGLLLAGCEQKPAAAPKSSGAAGTTNSTTGAAPSLPTGLILASMPENAKSVTELKPTAKAGDEVVLRARVGGEMDPFVDGRAIFTVMDTEMPACSDNPDDACATPWDYCCETQTDRTKMKATVRVVDAQGQPLKTSIKGVGGIEPLSEVIVVGKVAPRDNESILVVDATGIYARPWTKPAE